MKFPDKSIVYEKVSTADFVSGHIEDILYDEFHVFKGVGKDSQGNPKPDTTATAVRLVFVVDGLKFPKKTTWMRLSNAGKSNLFKKYISSLVADAKEYMQFDLDQLKGMKVKMLWADNEEFQNIETIRPADGKKIKVLKEEKAA